MPNLKAFARIGLKVAEVMVPQIAQVEQAVKEIKAGPDKKAAVMDAVKASIDLSEVLSGHEIADQDLLIQGLGKINDGYVDVMRALDPKPT